MSKFEPSGQLRGKIFLPLYLGEGADFNTETEETIIGSHSEEVFEIPLQIEGSAPPQRAYAAGTTHLQPNLPQPGQSFQPLAVGRVPVCTVTSIADADQVFPALPAGLVFGGATFTPGTFIVQQAPQTSQSVPGAWTPPFYRCDVPDTIRIKILNVTDDDVNVSVDQAVMVELALG